MDGRGVSHGGAADEALVQQQHEVHPRLAHWRQLLAAVETALRDEMQRPSTQRRRSLLLFLYREQVVARAVVTELQRLAEPDRLLEISPNSSSGSV